ncbi:MAG: SBBP repeat-containing protein [Flavobacteriales bacterium]|nr:SBBP repeat-containing protein [Flavobacteriales bacterium]
MQHRNNRSSTALVLPFILVAHGLAAQTPELHWAAQFGGTSSSLGRAVAVDAQGNVYTGGRFNGQVDMDPGPGTLPFTSAGSTDVLLTKVDAQGALLWARSWGAAGQDDAFALAVDAQGNVHVAGIFEGAVDFDPGPGLALLSAFGGSDVFVSKFDPSGELLWARQLGGNSTDRCTAIAVDPQGNVYTAGTFQSQADFDPGPGFFNLTATQSRTNFVSKLNADGAFVWAKAVAGALNELPLALTVDPAGEVLLCGGFQGTADFDPGPGQFLLTANGLDAFVARLDTEGELLWAQTLSGPQQVVARGVALNANGDLQVVGNFLGTVDLDPGPGTYELTAPGNSAHAFVLKLTASGQLIQAAQIGGTGNAFAIAHAVAVDAEDNAYVAGAFRGTADVDPGPGELLITAPLFLDNMLVFSLDGDGELRWAAQVEGANEGVLNGVALGPQGAVLATGYFQGSVDVDPGPGVNTITAVAQTDALLLKLLPAGTVAVPERERTEMLLYPNPSPGDFVVALGTDALVLLELLDMSGRAVYSEQRMITANTPMQVQLAGRLAPGTYVLRVSSQLGRSEQRIVVGH